MSGYFFKNMKLILGLKQEMTQIFDEGEAIPVTKIMAGPCFISQIKTEEKDSYIGLQLAFVEKKKGKTPLKGHLKGIGDKGFFQYLKEFRVDAKDPILEKVKKGDKITADLFEKGEKVKATGVSKGKGFQGVVKRHGFAGGPASHGHKDQLRMPGSIGALGPAHVFKGTKMAGRMGGEQTTMSNLRIVSVEPENNVIYVRGAVPGARNGLVLLSNENEFKIPEKKQEKAVEEKKQEAKPKETAEKKPEEEKKS